MTRGVDSPRKDLPIAIPMKPSAATGTRAGGVSGETRRVMLQDASESVGASWALECVNALCASGRKIEGGWPGTLPEARARVVNKLSTELSARGWLPLDTREVDVVATSTNAEAKRSWQLAVKRRTSHAG